MTSWNASGGYERLIVAEGTFRTIPYVDGIMVVAAGVFGLTPLFYSIAKGCGNPVPRRRPLGLREYDIRMHRPGRVWGQNRLTAPPPIRQSTETVRFKRRYCQFMANLTAGDQEYLERILNMSKGYVLDFTDATFEQLFRRHGIDIHGARYRDNGTSKAKKLRSFWNQEPDLVVGKILSEMLGVYETKSKLGSIEMESVPYEECREIVARLCGKATNADPAAKGEFSDKWFEALDVRKLPVGSDMHEIIRARLDEAQKCLSAEAYLSAVIMCGSVLEAVLLGAAEQDPESFHRSKSSPKRDGKPRPFPQWSLANFIDVARDIGLLKADAQTFSHGLRDFRNYIHPAKQASSNFVPRRETARLCLDALAVALADVAKEA